MIAREASPKERSKERPKERLKENKKNEITKMLQSARVRSGVESPFAWLRLAAAMALATIGTVGMWSVPVVLPAVQAEFGVARADASLPFTLAMVGFALGGVLMGRLADRFGVAAPVACGALALALGYVGAGFAASLMPFALMHVAIGVGASATFGPIMADTSRWFTHRRGIAVALAACGTYLGGAIWPPVLQHFMTSEGWRATLIGVGAFCALTTIPLLLVLRGRRSWKRRHGTAPPPRDRSSASRPMRSWSCSALRALPAASRWRCRRFISWPIAATSAMASRAAPRCSR
ncbi:MAG TPA: MFS transporter [Pseudomonadota bacterium]|nr:MFS transporter [Pseudomonadota bacterium]